MQTLQLLPLLAALTLPVVGAWGASSGVPAYDVSGVAIHQCSCRYACPCMFENAPEKCALAAVYHINGGAIGGVNVAGLSFISVDGTPPGQAAGAGGDCCRPAPHAKTNSPGGVIYLDARATPAQRRALLTILRDHGEWPGAGRPVKSVTIQFTPTKTGYATVVPGLFRGEVSQVRSRTGTPIIVDGVGIPEGPRWVVGRSTVNDLHDKAAGVHWSLPDTNGSWTLMHWTHS